MKLTVALDVGLISLRGSTRGTINWNLTWVFIILVTN